MTGTYGRQFLARHKSVKIPFNPTGEWRTEHESGADFPVALVLTVGSHMLAFYDLVFLFWRKAIN